MNAILAALLLAGLAISVSIAEPTDWAAQVEGEAEVTCVKTPAQCLRFAQAVSSGWIHGVLPGTAVRCKPHPGCFSDASNCIAGYNCR